MLVDVLYGDFNPSGRLPYTTAKSPTDYSAQLLTATAILLEHTAGPSRRLDTVSTRPIVPWADVGGCLQNDIEPRFEFGFGLSYTNFSYSGLAVRKVNEADGTFSALEAAWAEGEPSPNVEGGSTAIWLHRPAFEVSFKVTNTGKVTGGEVRLCLFYALGRASRC